MVCINFRAFQWEGEKRLVDLCDKGREYKRAGCLSLLAMQKGIFEELRSGNLRTINSSHRGFFKKRLNLAHMRQSS